MNYHTQFVLLGLAGNGSEGFRDLWWSFLEMAEQLPDHGNWLHGAELPAGPQILLSFRVTWNRWRGRPSFPLLWYAAKPQIYMAFFPLLDVSVCEIRGDEAELHFFWLCQLKQNRWFKRFSSALFTSEGQFPPWSPTNPPPKSRRRNKNYSLLFIFWTMSLWIAYQMSDITPLSL